MRNKEVKEEEEKFKKNGLNQQKLHKEQDKLLQSSSCYYPQQKVFLADVIHQSLIQICGGGIFLKEKEEKKEEGTTKNNDFHCNDNNKDNGMREKEDKKRKITNTSTTTIDDNDDNNNNSEEDWKIFLRKESSTKILFLKSSDEVPHDIEIKIIPSLFHRFINSNKQKHKKRKKHLKKQRQQQQEEKKENNDQSIHNNLEEDMEIYHHRQKTNEEVDNIGCLFIKSDYGIVRKINSPKIFAQLLLEKTSFVEKIIQNDEDEDETSSSSSSSSLRPSAFKCRHVRINEHSGIIYVTTLQRELYLRKILHRVPCPYCNKWFGSSSLKSPSCRSEEEEKKEEMNNSKDNNNKGLWWHIQTIHKIEHSISVTNARIESNHYNHNPTQCRAIIPYHNDTNKNASQLLELVFEPKLSNPSNSNRGMTTSRSSTHNDDDHEMLFNCVKNGNLNEFIEQINNKMKKYKNQHLLESCNDDDDDNTMMVVVDGQVDNVISKIVDKDGSSLILWSAGCGQLHILKYLVEKCNCDYLSPQKQNSDNNSNVTKNNGFIGRTTLHWSSRNGHLHIIKYLIEEVLQQPKKKTQQQQQEKEQRQLLHNVINIQTNDGTTPFCLAAYQNHIHVLKYFHESHKDIIDVHKINKFGCNAVHWCAQQQQQHNSNNNENASSCLDTMKYLYSIGCDFYLINVNGHSIVHKAAQRKQHELSLWLFNTVFDATNNKNNHSTNWTTTSNSTAGGSGSTSSSRKRSHTYCYKSLLLVGPDNDGCCPSDLAGMSGDDDLAFEISRQEIRLVHNMLESILCQHRCQRDDEEAAGAISSSSSSSSSSRPRSSSMLKKLLVVIRNDDNDDNDLLELRQHLPTWFINGVETYNRDRMISNKNELSLFEPNGGVRRMIQSI